MWCVPSFFLTHVLVLPHPAKELPARGTVSVQRGNGSVADRLVRVCAGIQEMLERVAKEKGMVWEEFFGKLKSNNQWHVEVY